MTDFNQALPLLPLTVGLPLLAAMACLLVNKRTWQNCISIIFALGLTATVVGLFISAQGTEHWPRYTLGGWGAPLGIELMVDGLSLVLLLVTSIVILVLSIYSAQYFSEPAKARRFWPLWWLLAAGLNAAFISADAFNIYVALEMIGLSAVALVALAGTRTALVAALRYALVGLLGSLCYLLGVALLYRSFGTLDLAQLAAQIEAGPISWAALCLISVGLLLKTALLPLHFWLPPAHASAPAPVSAALSALVVKASFYLLARFWLDALSPAVTEIAANFLGILGAIAIIWGSVAAYRSKRLKLLVAYSTVAQLGYLFLLFPLAFANSSSGSLSDEALIAVAYFILAHALAKAAMFLAAGNILVRYGHDDIHKLQGLAQQQPLGLVTFAIAGVSLIGLPPSGGFIAKWLMLNAAVDNGHWWWVLVMLAGGLFAAVYIFRLLNIAFDQSKAGCAMAVPMKSVPNGMSICGFALAISAVLLGFNAEWIIDTLSAGHLVEAQALNADTVSVTQEALYDY